jgi:two-component system, chemotaxis family, protein-glutamate methylesterase/glutaminase
MKRFADPGRPAERPKKALLDIEAIVMGASAGGVDALAILFDALPAGFKPSILVVVHIPADRPSRLAELYRQRCALEVREALDKERVAPGTIYFAPPDYHLLVEPDHTLSLSSDPPVAFSRPSIDVLFESAAVAYREKLLGIVLSGANSDGAAGLATIRDAGGHAWVQEPEDAAADAMPAAAIAHAGADLILPVRDMAERLAQLRSGRAVAI